ncbi:MAG: glycosyltransferase family 39 protein [Leptolyngbya sp. SIO1E4]|nr:glycosyltransferase family 39 protein [Leptolyngbya sp. SIO1E4]
MFHHSDKNLRAIIWSLRGVPLGFWAGFIVALASTVRIIQYCFNRSLWADESVLALNIVNRSYGELLQPLDYDQGAPFGFLILAKFATQLLGDNEYALRLFPLIGGIATLIIFYSIARHYLQGSSILIALTLIGFLDPVVYFSTEVKQYSTDATIALICFWLAVQVPLKQPPFKVFLLAATGALLIWCSHPAIFVLAGVTFSLLLRGWGRIEASPDRNQKDIKKGFLGSHFRKFFGLIKQQILTRKNLIIYASWFISFLLFYLISIQGLSANEALQESWRSKEAYPDSYNPILFLIWFIDRLGRVFHSTLEFPAYADGVAIAAFVIGCISLFKRRRSEFLTLFSPIFATLFAAYLQKYPFHGRLVFFLTPFFVILVAAGIDQLLKVRNPYLKSLSLLMAVFLLSQPLLETLPLFYQPKLRGDIKPVIEYVQRHQKSGDVLYIFQRGIRQFEFYADRYGYAAGDYIVGIEDLDDIDGSEVSEQERIRYQHDLDQLRGNPRVWVLFSHAWVEEENALMATYLDCLGQRKDTFQAVGAFVYLYDLSDPSAVCNNRSQMTQLLAAVRIQDFEFK